MRYQELYDEVYEEYEKISASHGVDIMDLPLVAVVKTAANTVHHLQVTGWRLGSDKIELLVEP